MPFTGELSWRRGCSAVGGRRREEGWAELGAVQNSTQGEERLTIMGDRRGLCFWKEFR